MAQLQLLLLSCRGTLVLLVRIPGVREVTTISQDRDTRGGSSADPVGDESIGDAVAPLDGGARKSARTGIAGETESTCKNVDDSSGQASPWEARRRTTTTPTWMAMERT